MDRYTPIELAALVLSLSANQVRGHATADFLARPLMADPGVAELWAGQDIASFDPNDGLERPSRYFLKVM